MSTGTFYTHRQGERRCDFLCSRSPRDAGRKEEVDLFYFYFPGSKRQILLELWNMNSSISARYILSRNWRPRASPPSPLFLEHNNKKWVIIIGYEQQFIIGSSQWLSKNEKGGNAYCARLPQCCSPDRAAFRWTDVHFKYKLSFVALRRYCGSNLIGGMCR